MVNDLFVPLSKRLSILYCQLTDFKAQIYWPLDNPKKSVWRTYIQWLWLWTWTWWVVTNCWKIIPFLIMIIAVWRASSKKWPWKTCSLCNSKTLTRYITFKIFLCKLHALQKHFTDFHCWKMTLKDRTLPYLWRLVSFVCYKKKGK